VSCSKDKSFLCGGDAKYLKGGGPTGKFSLQGTGTSSGHTSGTSILIKGRGWGIKDKIVVKLRKGRRAGRSRAVQGKENRPINKRGKGSWTGDQPATYRKRDFVTIICVRKEKKDRLKKRAKGLLTIMVLNRRGYEQKGAKEKGESLILDLC